MAGRFSWAHPLLLSPLHMNDIPIASVYLMAYSLRETYNPVPCLQKRGGLWLLFLRGHLLGASTCNWYTRYS